MVSLLCRMEFSDCALKGLGTKSKWFHALLQATCQEGNFILTNHKDNNNINNINNNKSFEFCQCQMLLLLQKYLRRPAFQLFPLANLQTTSSFLLFLSELESLLKLCSLAAFGVSALEIPSRSALQRNLLALFCYGHLGKQSFQTADLIGEFQLEKQLGAYLHMTVDPHLCIWSLAQRWFIGSVEKARLPRTLKKKKKSFLALKNSLLVYVEGIAE